MFGTDPEVFSIVKNFGIVSPPMLEYFSGIKQIGGDNRHPIYIKTNNYSWMSDGAAWELTIKPFNSAIELYSEIQIALNHLEEFLGNLTFQDYKVELSVKPVEKIDTDFYFPYLMDEKMYQGFIFGCDKDDDAIDLNYLCRTIEAEKHNKRYGGGHLHFSGNTEFIHENIMYIVRLLAITVGTFSIANSKFLSLDKERNNVYGKPGRFRKQKHGVEYRSPSNSWLSLNINKFEEMCELGKIAIDLVGTDKGLDLLDLLPESVDAINKTNKSACIKIQKELNLL